MKMNSWQRRLDIYKYAYSNGINSALYNAEHSQRYKQFEKDVRDGLYEQIESIAELDGLPLLISLAKSPSSVLMNQLAALVMKVSIGKKIGLAAYLVWSGEQGGQAALDKLEIQGIFGLRNPGIIKYFNNYTNLIIKSVDQYTKKWIAEKIQLGKDKGLSPYEIQKLLLDDGKGITKLRAERIVLTETAKAMTTVENIASRRYGIKDHIWRTSADERVCPICRPLEGELVEVGRAFSVGTEGPPAHVSCRCYMEDVIPLEWRPPSKAWLGE
jgi:SPP1 gp7 family putative phage head morphogenesis protein